MEILQYAAGSRDRQVSPRPDTVRLVIKNKTLRHEQTIPSHAILVTPVPPHRLLSVVARQEMLAARFSIPLATVEGGNRARVLASWIALHCYGTSRTRSH